MTMHRRGKNSAGAVQLFMHVTSTDQIAIHELHLKGCGSLTCSDGLQLIFKYRFVFFREFQKVSFQGDTNDQGIAVVCGSTGCAIG